jgi:hypothetical protein
MAVGEGKLFRVRVSLFGIEFAMYINVVCSCCGWKARERGVAVSEASACVAAFHFTCSKHIVIGKSMDIQ